MDQMYVPYNANNQYERDARLSSDNKGYPDVLCSSNENPHKISFNIDSQPFNPNSSLMVIFVWKYFRSFDDLMPVEKYISDLNFLSFRDS